MNRDKVTHEFEKYPELSGHIERMANTGHTGAGTDWNAFLHELNNALKLSAQPLPTAEE